jgi:hypothetical protein
LLTSQEGPRGAGTEPTSTAFRPHDVGTLIATITSSIVLIALPDIVKGSGIAPLVPANTSYLL